MRRPLAAAVVAAAVLSAGAGCGTTSSRHHGPVGSLVSLRLGYVPAMADAPAMVATLMGYYRADLGGGIRLDLQPFASTSQEIQALASGRLAAAYTDPVAAVVTWQHDPAAIQIISGAASGGAELVVRHGITSAAALRGASLAVPASASAQDVALRYWLRQHNLATAGKGSGIKIKVMAGAAAVRQFTAGTLSGGWEPPPYDTEMAAAGGQVLVNEDTLWPAGRFATAVLVASRRYLAAHRAVINDLLRAQIQAEQFLTTSRTSAEAATGNELATTLGKGLPGTILAGSFAQLSYTDNPLSPTIFIEARHAATVGLMKPVASLRAIYNLAPLNSLLRSAALPPAIP